MEHSLQHRERVGVQDFILLEDYTSESAFIDNLRKRFAENAIYTYIGSVLISVNPYKSLPIYNEDKIKLYFKKAFFEAPPHVFAIADNAYRSLVYEHREQCVLISGESGSGKTEASKRVLEYIAARTKHLKTVESVKDKLLQSNPLLEAFGNAKTNKNDNSSRFGKYMDVQFNYEGAPEGGHILNYLLEKSRVVSQMAGERNFHIFYQMLAGCDKKLMDELKLQKNPRCYKYTANTVSAVSQNNTDAEQFRVVQDAMKVIEISDSEQAEIFRIVASVLHLGNVSFAADTAGHSMIPEDDSSVDLAATLLQVDSRKLRSALTSRTIEARRDVVNTPLDVEQAQYARDALAKAVYDKHFSWLVKRLNASLAPKERGAASSVMGILDIYGFEIFPRNSFEQFCINFCNEKLQQLFIQLTLQSEQEEYRREGIEWEVVDYFDNIVICDLIEAKHQGIISILDDECLRPGDASDATFLAEMAERLDGHPRFKSHRRSDIKTQKIMGRNEFCIVHYAGEVTYDVTSFLEKNNDLLFRDLQSLMASSGNSIIGKCFQDMRAGCKKRPETAITQFKNSLNDLIKILSSKEPSYIRCIKPNDMKMPMQFDDRLVSHQVKYLGLMENLRVRRAGFAYRRTYDAFLERYKCLSPETWPRYRGPARDGVQKLVEALNYSQDEYRMGNTKIFIRHPKTLFSTEDAYQSRLHYIATIIQSRWRGHYQRSNYLKMKMAAVVMQKWVRRFQAQNLRKRRKNATVVIRAFIKGFISRNGPESADNVRFISIAKVHWLRRLSKQLPTSVLDESWPQSPVTCQEASKQLQSLHKTHLARQYRLALTAEDRRQFELKISAENMFKGKKNSYPSSVKQRFIEDRIASEHQCQKSAFLNSPSWVPGEKLIYSSEVIKYDRRGYKPRARALLVSDAAVYVAAGVGGAGSAGGAGGRGKRAWRLKHRLPLDKLRVVLTNETDSLMILRIPQDLKKDKGDLIMSVPYLIEALTIVTEHTQKPNLIEIVDTRTIVHTLSNGKAGGTIEVVRGPEPAIHRAKTGNLLVVATP